MRGIRAMRQIRALRSAGGKLSSARLGIVLLALSLVCAILGYINLHARVYVGPNVTVIEETGYADLYRDSPLISDFYANVSVELASIALAILIIDKLNERRQEEALKGQLIRELTSGYRGFMVRALRELQVKGWLEDGSLAGMNLKYVDMSKLEMEGVDLQRADLALCNLSGADLSGARFCNANLLLSNLEGANLSRADFTSAVLIDADLRNSNLYAAVLCNVDLSEANLQAANLRYADMREAKLKGARMREAFLGEANLRGADLCGVDLGEARFSFAGVEGPDLVGAIYDQDTKWPPGIDPAVAGALFHR